MLAGQEGNMCTPSNKDAFKFNPSQNFKHRKKYLKWKYENSNLSTVNDLPPSTSPNENPCKQEQIKSMDTIIQPPLPPYPPPPDSPVHIKQEVDNENYQHREHEPLPDFGQSKKLAADTFTTNQNVKLSKPEEIMCHRFVRGLCNKGFACKFVHRIIKDQLKNVYTFCREFQNKGCFLSECKYVHCSIFEQEHFYRTGELPPHATEHFKNMQLPSLPISQTASPAETMQIPSQVPPQVPYQVPPQVYVNVPSTFETSVQQSMTAPGCSTFPIGNGARADVYQFGVQAYTTSSNKRQWSESSCSSYSQRDLSFSEPPAKKCKDCDINAFRYEFYKNKVKEMVLASDDHEQKIEQLNKKTQRLIKLLECVVEPMNLLSNINF